MRIRTTMTTLLIAAGLAAGAYALPGCDEGGSETVGPRPQTTTTPGVTNTDTDTTARTAGSRQQQGTEPSANPQTAPNPHGGGAGSVDATHGAIQPDGGPQHPHSITQDH